MGSLQRMMNRQREFQRSLPPEKGGGDPRDRAKDPNYFKDMMLATSDELHELLGEVGWKPWASSRHVNRDAARGEWIDAWHFMMNMAEALEMDEKLIEDLYNEKQDRNRKRQAEGYTGLNKCPGCRRAFDDIEKVRRGLGFDPLAVTQRFVVKTKTGHELYCEEECYIDHRENSSHG